MFSRRRLELIRKKARRKGIWFRILSQIERAVVSLTIRCVDTARSPKLVKILKNIVERLKEAMKSQVKRLMEKVGRPAAQKIAYLAASWGNIRALNWAFNSRFVKYLTVMHINTPIMYQP